MSVFSGIRSLVYLAEITYFDTTEKTLYVGTHGYTTEPTDTPANQFFEPLIESPMLYAMNAWEPDGQTSRSGHGELRLINTEGQLNFLADCALDGRAFRMMCAYEDDDYATFKRNTLMAGTMMVPQWEDDIVVIQLKDKTALFERPFQPSLYTGANVLPAGIEGNDDLKDTRKPYLLGRVLNIAPPNVNTSALIYQVSSGAITDVSAVYAGGVELTKGNNYTSQTDMEANAPAAGAYRVWLAGGCFRLGSDPVKLVTCDAAEGADAAARYPAQLIKRAVQYVDATLTLSQSDITALAADAPYECGIWINANETALDVIDSLATGAGAWWTFDATGQFRTGQLKRPNDKTPVATLTAIEILDDRGIERVSTGDGPDGLPPNEIRLRYGKNYTVQNNDLFGAVTQARKTWLEKDWRTLAASSSTVKTKYLLSGSIERETPILLKADATTEANRIKTLRCQRRDTVRLTVQVAPDIQAVLIVGAVIELQYPRYGYDAGRKMVVIGIEHDARIGLFTLTLWG